MISLNNLLSGLIGAMIGPSFTQFIIQRKNKIDEKIKYLDEAYLEA